MSPYGTRMLGAACLLLTGMAAVSAQESKTIRGEVIDPALYLREGRHGPEVEEQIFEAVDGGQSLAILEEGTDQVYQLLAGEPGEDPSDLVYEYAGQRVTVTGPVYSRGGATGIIPTDVQPVEPQPATLTTPEETPAP